MNSIWMAIFLHYGLPIIITAILSAIAARMPLKKSVKDLADLLGCLDTALTDDKIDAVELKEIYTRAKTLGQDLKPVLQNLSASKSQNKK
jgi:hypothetical protein